MKVRSYQIILLDDTTRGFKLFHCHPPRAGQRRCRTSQMDSPVFRYFQQTRAKYLSCNLVYETDQESLLQREARQQLKLLRAGILFSVFCRATI